VAKRRYLGRRTDKTRWTLRMKVHLPRGSYLVNVRGTDAVGHRESGHRKFNRRVLRVR
jgi:hypothetical protein